jgi:FixJ family two-component response regulator
MTSHVDTDAPLRLALVDDDPSVRRAIGRLLKSLGFGVDLYSSAYAFLSQPRSQWPDCAIVDVRMPGQTGIALVDTLRAIAARVPVILITGDADTSLAERAGTCGAVALLSKPIDAWLLAETLKRVAAGRHRRDDAALLPQGESDFP